MGLGSGSRDSSHPSKTLTGWDRGHAGNSVWIMVANIFTLQVVLLPVFPVSLVVEPTVLVRLLSVTCAVLVACSHPPRSGESGTSRSARARSESRNIAGEFVPISPMISNLRKQIGDMPPLPLLPPPPSLLFS
jgi:hypothetical protein